MRDSRLAGQDDCIWSKMSRGRFEDYLLGAIFMGQSIQVNASELSKIRGSVHYRSKFRDFGRFAGVELQGMNLFQFKGQ